MAPVKKVYKSKSKSKRVAHTENDNRYTQANRINNVKEPCKKCGTDIHATQDGQTVTVNCSTFSFSTTIGLCFDYTDAYCNFIDEHP
jgi:hypothetical protein